MFKKIAIGIILVFLWLAFAIGASSPFYFSLIRAEILPNYERYGDLYRFANLPQFKQLQPECERKFSKMDTSLKQKVALYTVGDSFLEEWRVNFKDFPYKFYKNIHWHDEKIQTILDTTLTNILVLECAERHSRERFGTVPLNYKIVKDYESEPWVPRNRFQRVGDFIQSNWKTFKKYSFTPETPDHLEHLLFSYDWMLPLKELKASMNMNWFDRVNTSASLSKDRKHLFYFKDTDTTLINSSYSKLTDNEIDSMVHNMDSTVKAYKAAGFDQVFISIIPSKASILAPNDGVYNHLIERFEAKATGKFPIIDIYKQYSENRSKVFEFNETHWTCFGKNIWLTNTTNLIDEFIEKSKSNTNSKPNTISKTNSKLNTKSTTLNL
jgi:hypothetical protein